MRVFGAIEAGGTKFVCAVGNASGELFEQIVIPTTTPKETMPQVIDFFKVADKKNKLEAMGIASFGPVDPDPASKYFGYITTTPKLAWSQFNFVGTMRNAFPLPIGFDTDVNGAAMGEYRFGAARGLSDFIYITVGTGIGAGGMVNGKLMHGLLHPEMGHILIPQDKTKDPFPGVCPFHQNCLEGLASGPAILKRWNVKSAEELSPDHEAWDLEATYLAEALANYIMILSPKKIVIGGGVMHHKGLLEKIHPKVIQFLAGYIKHRTILEDTKNYIVLPGLGDKSGIMGAIALAELAYREARS